MKQNQRLTLPDFFAETLSRHGDRDALALVGSKPMTYRQTGKSIRALMALLEQTGTQQGDKVAILSTNQPDWAIAYFATTFMGAVVVPLLPEFLTTEIAKLLEHAEVKTVFVSEGLKHKIDGLSTPFLQTVIGVEEFNILRSREDHVAFYPEAEPVHNYAVNEDDLAAIIYTSGTTGNPKGVMLTHRNVCFNAIQGFEIQHIVESDRFLSILPLSHTYENTLGLILPMYRGASVYFLGRPPVPSILLPALQEVRPTTILTVPMIIEKIFRNKILPTLTKNATLKLLYAMPPVRKVLHRVAAGKLKKTFGGQVRFFGVGGAKLNKTVERFLIEGGFPYAVGYGLTECAPLLAGFNPGNPKLQSTGPVCKEVQIKIERSDAGTGEGEIWVKGPNIMKGYYKEPEMTREIMNPDGWLKTGDLGVLDENGYLYIKGRVKSVIVRSNGENVYPEDIESVINNFRYVLESLVVEKKGRLVAYVHFNREEIEQRYIYLKTEMANYAEQKIEEYRRELIIYVNARVNKFSQLQLVVSQPDPFQKTATQKIKRFLYTEVS
ncbi:MAG: long-chain fatty acid--CoA ligase [Alphaproteobacteria bacterium]|nr:long-chain fatty acid--CoA ligase [Alphaproteobacteria bacterium]